MQRRNWILLGLIALLIVPLGSIAGQEQPTITIALSAFLKNNFDESVFDAFEAEHGVQVYVNYVNSEAFYDGDIEAYLDALAEYAAAADVLTVTPAELTLFATRAGYFLDLSPLTNADAALNAEDFFPAAWESVQWDNSVWALPSTLDTMMLLYESAAFDEAGLGYPSERWTLDDLLSAALELTQRDANGDVALLGLQIFGSVPALLRSVYGQNFADESGSPRFANAALADLLTQWLAYQEETAQSSDIVFGMEQSPMRIINSAGFSLREDQQTLPVAIPLPGGSVSLNLSALAVSSGTQQPELAYELAKYLTFNAAFASSPFTGMSARQTLAQEQTIPSSTGATNDVSITVGNGMMVVMSGSSPEAKARVIELLPNALTIPEMGYSNYIDDALRAMAEDGLDAQTALMDAEARAAADLQAAMERRATVSIIVATPPPVIVLQPGEIELKFGLQSFVQPTPNLERWQQLAADFAAAQPDVGAVTIDADFGDVTQFAERSDCFYLSANAVPSLDGTTVTSLDPFLDADPNFNREDVVGGLMAQLEKDDRTWAYPLTIQPQALTLKTALFAEAGVPLPDGGWSIEQFADALQSLSSALGKEALVPRDISGETLMMLIAAYGGLPIDYRTTPAALNFSDPATVDAIRQVLDLAKAGYIDYQELAAGGGFRAVMISGESEDAISTDILGGFRRIIGGHGEETTSRLVTYPTGIYNGASYSIGTGYISATAQNPDACYRWLSYIAEHIDVFGMMPARQSQIDDPTFQASAGDNARFYSAYADVLASANTIVFPSATSGISAISDFIVQFWLNRAFDNYVLRDGDLEADLTEAQGYAAAFQQCVAQLPPGDNTPEARGFNADVLECATTADPSAASLFGPPPS